MIRLAAQAIQRGASQQWRAAAARSRDAGGCCCSSSGAARSERGSSGGKGLVDRAVAAGAGLLGAALAVHGAQDALESGSSHAWPVADATVRAAPFPSPPSKRRWPRLTSSNAGVRRCWIQRSKRCVAGCSETTAPTHRCPSDSGTLRGVNTRGVSRASCRDKVRPSRTHSVRCLCVHARGMGLVPASTYQRGSTKGPAAWVARPLTLAGTQTQSSCARGSRRAARCRSRSTRRTRGARARASRGRGARRARGCAPGRASRSWRTPSSFPSEGENMHVVPAPTVS
jgi:hypothetical protein